MNFIDLIEKYAEKLISDENSKEKRWGACFPEKEKIQLILDPSCNHLRKKSPEAILMIYFLLHYLDKTNEMTLKEKKPWKYDIIFLYSLPLQFHIYLYQILISQLKKEQYAEEIKLNENLKKLIILFLPTLRSPAFLFIDFTKFYFFIRFLIIIEIRKVLCAVQFCFFFEEFNWRNQRKF